MNTARILSSLRLSIGRTRHAHDTQFGCAFGRRVLSASNKCARGLTVTELRRIEDEASDDPIVSALWAQLEHYQDLASALETRLEYAAAHPRH